MLKTSCQLIMLDKKDVPGMNHREVNLMSKNRSIEKIGETWYISKILRTVENSKCFFFNITNGSYTGRTARSLRDMYSILKTVNVKSINFHFRKGDFQRWIQNIIGDIKLSNKIRKIPKNIRGEKLRSELIKIISERISELNSI
jgi:hypothetical protein